ncbi:MULTISPECIES: hypothetical protein [Prauserella salsuginis group]|uniref:ATP/GTP-binding protein n=1 Tax=Prauserella salsuginis TaxID=387889 RepID=A0ABW6FZZ6_9PSEU|nr:MULTISPECIES: hypothetical protein [Prauserella salsuginis group]MCR3721141.1 hypothetical protein [Prauserella flava]MCR3734779.1 hypothetical protein [Prauserella salsuginis]
MLGRAIGIAGMTATLVWCAASPAWAGGWGSVDCNSDPTPYCDLGAGSAPNPPSAPDPAPPRPQVEPQPEGSGETAPEQQQPQGDRIVGGSDTEADCSYVLSDYQPPTGGVQTITVSRSSGPPGDVRPIAHTTGTAVAEAGPPGGDVELALDGDRGGGWYVYRCSSEGTRDSLYRAPVWIPASQAPADAKPPAPSPQELARQARSQLRLPNPTIGSNPAGTQLVRVPTWVWIDSRLWHPHTATASVPGVSVTATARPTSVSWSMGDGTTLTCRGPGTEFPADADPGSASPDCGHTYQRSSAGAADARFPVTATVSWQITWSGAGEQGRFPNMATDDETSFRVAEAQALGTG